MHALSANRCFSFIFKKIFNQAMSELSTVSLSAPVANDIKEDVIENAALKSTGGEPVAEPFTRIKKRKFALLLAYSGVGYLGLQRNPGRKTIEEDLLSALFKAGIINEEAYQQPQVIQFQRAARTDKGVSAVRQILSARLPEEMDIKLINSYLPEQIRLLGVKRTTKGFDCKGKCDARTYSYTMPTFALAPHDQAISTDFRINDTILQRVRDVLKLYEGTHNYHNFTSRRKPLDPSCQRYIMNFTCTEPNIMDSLEFVTLKVKGQSFMLHQIRKMVGLAIAIVRGLTTDDTIKKAWEAERIDIPVAPGLGLVLEDVHYDRYNTRYGKDGLHDPIDWSEYEQELEEFKTKYIISNILKTEKEENSMFDWLSTVSLHRFDVRHDDIPLKRKRLDGEPELEEDSDSEPANKKNTGSPEL